MRLETQEFQRKELIMIVLSLYDLKFNDLIVGCNIMILIVFDGFVLVLDQSFNVCFLFES